MEEEKQLLKLQKIKELADDGKADLDDVAESLSIVLEVILKIKKHLEQEMANNKGEMTEEHKEMYSEMAAMESRIKEMHSKMEDKMAVDKKEMMKYCMEEVKKCMDMMPEMPDMAVMEKKIADMEAKIPKMPDELTPFQIADKLESIKDESKKLEISAIKDLRKELDDLKKKWSSRPIFGGGGFSANAMNFHLVDDETPTGAVNGVNTIFTIANTPSPASSLKVYKDGQRMKLTTDYTFSGRTITFLSAPLTDSIISVDYRT